MDREFKGVLKVSSWDTVTREFEADFRYSELCCLKVEIWSRVLVVQFIFLYFGTKFRAAASKSFNLFWDKAPLFRDKAFKKSG